MSQEARGLIRCGDTIAAGGVTRKQADRSLTITHTSYDLTSWSVIAALPPRPVCLRSLFKTNTGHTQVNEYLEHKYTSTETCSHIQIDPENEKPCQCPHILWHNVCADIHVMLSTHSYACDDPTTTQVSDAFYQLTTRGQERPRRLCFPVTFYSTASCEWRKPNNRANVSLFSSLSREQAAPLRMPLLFSEWYCAPQQHSFPQLLICVCGCCRESRGIMCCQRTLLLIKQRARDKGRLHLLLLKHILPKAIYKNNVFICSHSTNASVHTRDFSQVRCFTFT